MHKTFEVHVCHHKKWGDRYFIGSPMSPSTKFQTNTMSYISNMYIACVHQVKLRIKDIQRFIGLFVNVC